MKSFCMLVAFSAMLAVCVFSTKTAGAQTSSKAIFTAYPPYLCVGGGFVAMAGISRRDPLMVIPIDVTGIEAPQIIPLGGDEVLGMQCSAHYIELLVNDYKSGLNMPLYAVQWHSNQPSTIHEEQREDLKLPNIGSTPPAIDYKRDSLEWGGNRAGGYMRGDWYVWVPQVVDRPNNTYEVHFVSTHGKHCGKLVVTLLEETLDKKVNRSVPLVYIDACSD